MSVPLRASEGFKPEPPTLPEPKLFPLSYAQETMLYWDRLVPHSAVYNVPVAVRIAGPINVQALRKTIQLIFSRHEVLRSHFLFTEDEPIQVVDPVPPEQECVCEIELSSLSMNPAAVKDAVNAEARSPFKLSKDLMLRTVLFRLGQDEHILLLNMHHIAADGWSVGILIREVVEGYLAFSQGGEPDLPHLRTQYSDFAKWQKELLQGPERQRVLSFWREALAGLPQYSEALPPDRPRSSQQGFQGATVIKVVPESLLKALEELGQKVRATTFMALLTAFQTLLHLRSGKDTIVIGTPVANRARADFLDLIGCFINMVVIRGDLSGNPTFLNLLSRTRETALAAFFHPELPFSEVVRHLQPKRSVSYTPFFQVQVVYHNYPMPTFDWPGLKVTRFDIETGSSKFDFSLLMEPKNGLEIGFEYNTQLFEEKTMRGLLEQYTNILEYVVKSPETRIDEFPQSALTHGA